MSTQINNTNEMTFQNLNNLNILDENLKLNRDAKNTMISYIKIKKPTSERELAISECKKLIEDAIKSKRNEKATLIGLCAFGFVLELISEGLFYLNSKFHFIDAATLNHLKEKLNSIINYLGWCIYSPFRLLAHVYCDEDIEIEVPINQCDLDQCCQGLKLDPVTASYATHDVQNENGQWTKEAAYDPIVTCSEHPAIGREFQGDIGKNNKFIFKPGPFVQIIRFEPPIF